MLKGMQTKYSVLVSHPMLEPLAIPLKHKNAEFYTTQLVGYMLEMEAMQIMQ